MTSRLRRHASQKASRARSEGIMDRNWNGVPALLTLLLLFLSPMLYDFSQWIQHLLGGG